MSDPSDRDTLVGQVVVVDLSSQYVYLGQLVKVHADYLVLDGADAHDLRDSPTTREKYVLDCRQHGVRPNRRRVWINQREVVALSRLEDVLLD